MLQRKIVWHRWVFAAVVLVPVVWRIQLWRTPSIHAVTYSVTGLGGNATVSYFDGENRTRTQTVNLPWQQTVQVASGRQLSLTVQSGGESHLFIAIDGVQVRHVSREATGFGYALAEAPCCNATPHDNPVAFHLFS